MDINYEISRMAYWYCKRVKDHKEIYKYITDTYWAYCYCNNIKDRPEVSKYIAMHNGKLTLPKC